MSTFFQNLAQRRSLGRFGFAQQIMTRLIVAPVLPIVCAWAARRESTILRHGVALAATQAADARKIGVLHPEKVRLLAANEIPPENRFLRAIGTKLGLVSCRTIGMTLRYGIFIQADHWGDRRLLCHEFAHVAQYERLGGGFRRFLFLYLQECISPGYPLGDLEQEAKQAERSFD